ncbi:MAG: 16S rRNA (uracil(1498)-N(3))-methyltransferase [Planctomycetaceae bacterium]|nr:16S rRNA (uracil(1498)-N(3))-methyltransferase [Planctomycetaceae bacterium]
MADRFFCEDLTGTVARLSDAEAHHAIHVMRMHPGDILQLTDGGGTVAEGKIVATGRRSVEVEIVSSRKVPLPNRPALTVAAAAPKGDRLKWMIEKLTEIGVDRFVPLSTTRSVVDPRTSRLEKLQGTVIAAMKQSGRAFLMKLEPPVSIRDLPNRPAQYGERIVAAHPHRECRTNDPAAEESLAVPVADEATSHRNSSGDRARNLAGEDSSSVSVRRQTENATANSQRDTVLVIGPEGGLTDDEVEMLKHHGAEFISWPDSILRTETAAVTFAALILAQANAAAGR